MESGEEDQQNLSRAKELDLALKAFNISTAEQDLVQIVLAGLPPQYDTVRNVVVFGGQQHTLSQVEPMLMVAEQQNSAEGWTTHKDFAAAHFAHMSGRGRGRRDRAATFETKATASTDYSQAVPGTNNWMNPGVQCYQCKQMGHLAAHCPEQPASMLASARAY
jgi:hypothetical protein